MARPTIYDTRYLKFRRVVPDKPRKTEVWSVLSTMHGDLLGTIKWFGRWRQYAFFPELGTIYNRDCLDDISRFVRGLMESRRG